MIDDFAVEPEREKGIAVFSFVIIFIGLTAMLIVFEITFFSLLQRLWYAEKYEIWALQLIAIGSYVTILYVTAYSKLMRLLYLVFQLGASCLLLGAVLWINALWSLKGILGISIAFDVLGIVCSLKSKGTVLSKVKARGLLLVLLVSSLCVLSASILIYSPKQIEIDPQTEPELIFWCGPSQLPNETDVLEMCRDYKIGFASTIRNRTVGDTDLMDRFKTVLDNEVSLHFAIGVNDGFYATVGTVGDLPQTYKNIRDWFATEGILDNPYLKSFCLDAETPHEYVDEMNGKGPIDSINYAIDHYPTDEEVKESEEDLQEFVDAVRGDGKKAGLIIMGANLDSIDGDGDISLLFRNVYSLDVEWDYTVSMLYRTNRYLDADEDESSAEDLAGAFFDAFVGTYTEGTKFTTSPHSFYQNVATLQQQGDVQVDPDHQRVFVGNFKVEFEETDYIKNKEYQKDLDICRHFGEEEVWFYELGGFKYHYGGWDALKEIGEYNQQHDKWDLEYTSDDNINMVVSYGVIILFDFFAKFDEDLS